MNERWEQADPFFEALAQRRLLIVSGKGGVGRSTVSLLVAQALAKQGKRVLLATTGQDDRLAQLAGLHPLSSQPQKVNAHLSILELEPAVSMREYAEMVLFSRRLARAIFDSKVVRRLLAAVPGMEDFAILGKIWHEATRASNYDTVVFDGPASGHLKSTLRVPQSILDSIGQGPLAHEAQAMLQSLRDPQVTGLVLVGLSQAWPLTELCELFEALRQAPGMHSVGLVINQMWPDDLPELATLQAPPQDQDPSGVMTTGLGLLQDAQSRGELDAQVLRDWHAGLDESMAQLPLLRVPYARTGLDAPAALAELMLDLRQKAVASGPAPKPARPSDASLETERP